MPLNLRFMDAEIHTARPNAKPVKREKKARTRIRVKAKPKAERDQIAEVRRHCVDRDGYCRVETAHYGGVMADGYFVDGETAQVDAASACSGPSQWCHMHVKRRSQTRNQAPEIRHTSAESFMGCQKHHDEYDGRQQPRLYIRPMTRRGANGPMKFSRQG